MACPFKIELQDLLERDKLVYGINCGKKSTSSDVLGSLQLRKILLRQKKAMDYKHYKTANYKKTEL